MDAAPPWIAAELGWFVAEHGRQPWAIEGVLPTFLAVSPIPASSVAISLAGFVVFYTVLAVIDVFLLKKYVKLGPGATRRPVTAPDAPRPVSSRRPAALGVIMFDFETLKVIWWLLLGVLLIGFAIMDGFDLGVGMLLPFVARSDTERRVVHQYRRARLGRQPGVVDPGRRRDLCGVARALRRELLGILSGDAAGAGGADLAAGRLQVPQQNAGRRAGAPAGIGRCSSAARCPSLVFGVAMGNLLEGVPFSFDAELRATYAFGLFDLLNPFALLCGLVSVAMLLTHGAVYLAIKTDGEVAQPCANGFRALRRSLGSLCSHWPASGSG